MYRVTKCLELGGFIGFGLVLNLLPTLPQILYNLLDYVHKIHRELVDSIWADT